MYIILTSKPGQYRSEATDGITPVGAYDYFYCDRHIATFVLASIGKDSRVRIVDESSPPTVNLVPTRFFEKFSTREAALISIQELAGVTQADAQLVERNTSAEHGKTAFD
ncbi:MAG TPA: hypothetical protein VHV99_16120 [Paraburkholderia sp.]|jgi:hypothetical protein|nr:hypothetical protein [Paraburkholderia sp.]